MWNKIQILIAAITLMILSSCKTAKTEEKLRVVGYLPTWEVAKWEQIDYSALTHCIFSFATYKGDSITFDVESDKVEAIVRRCREENVRPMIALGGFGGFETQNYPLSTKEKRSLIISDVMKIVERYNLDGVDIDIEIKETDAMWNNFDNFTSELREALGRERLMTMAVGTWFTDSIKAETYKRFDFINMMTYDNAFGDGDVAPYEMSLKFIDYYMARGLTEKQLTIGVPFYGYSEGGVTRDWSEIIALDVANEYRDRDTTNGIYFNGKKTIKKKVELAKGYGGIMIWQLAEDDYGENSMLRLIKEEIKKE